MNEERGAATAVRPAEPPHPPDGGGRSVLEGAFALLGAVERAGEAGLTRLAAECGLPKTTTYRLLEQLVELGAVERSRQGYRMGSRIFRLGQGWQPYPGLRTAARAPARRLARLTGATVGLNVLREGQTLVLDWTPGDAAGALGRSLDAGVWPWFTAAGKVLVAGADPRLPLDPLTGSWHRQAGTIRDRGVAFDREEVAAGVCCVAVPVHGPNGAVLASLSAVTDPAHSLDRLAGAVQHAGRAIGAALRGR
ncbi:helix-turn-helix domain-containing protein [Streptomyces sp. NPDC004237]|uniref:IclR family transcriptional regulator n=1 Tax=Streptomyces sp. NPDC004237 TaxID=3154455 RepID=UPI0033AB3E52